MEKPDARRKVLAAVSAVLACVSGGGDRHWPQATPRPSDLYGPLRELDFVGGRHRHDQHAEPRLHQDRPFGHRWYQLDHQYRAGQHDDHRDRWEHLATLQEVRCRDDADQLRRR